MLNGHGGSNPQMHVAVHGAEAATLVEGVDGRARIRALPYENRHQEHVFRLHAEVFGPPAGAAFQERWSWAQERNLYPDQSPKWVLVDGESVVGFLATIPLPYSIEGSVLVAHTPCDYMVRPEYRFHGIKLMQRFFDTCANCVSYDDMAATIKVTEWLGGRQVATVVRYVRVLDARLFGMGREWGWVPPSLWWPLNLAIRGRDALHRDRVPFGGKVRGVEEFDARFERLSRRLAHWVPVTVARDLQFFRWRYGKDSPHANREIGVIVEPGGELGGYVVFCVSESTPRVGYILDLQVFLPDDTRSAAALLDYALRRVRDRKAWAVRYYHLTSPFTVPATVLKRHGFVARGGHPLLVRLWQERFMALAESQKNWNLNYGDCEASHAAI